MAFERARTWTDKAPRAQPFWYGAILAGISILALLLRAVGVGNYHGLIYDEYYYVPAADILLHRQPPVLVKHAVFGIDPNLLSHPPLAKELIALSIVLLGNHPWVWRLPGVAMGSLVPLMVAGIAWELFHRRTIAVGAAFLASLDGLLLTMARVALPDSSAVPLAILGLWLLLILSRRMRLGKAPSWWAWMGFGTILGLGLAAEWIGGQTMLVVWTWLFSAGSTHRRAWKRWIPSTTALPFLVYFATYFYSWPSGFHQSWLPKNPIPAFFKLQWLMLKDMWQLHFFHPWTSNAWSWMGIPRPTGLLLSVYPTYAIRLMAFSDPLVVWIGLFSLLGGLWIFRRDIERRQPWLFLGLWLFSFYATWLLTPRSKFLYYFTTSSVGLDILAAAGLALLITGTWKPGGILGLTGSFLTLLSLGYLLPMWTGIQTPRPFYHALWWPKSWNPRVRHASGGAQATQSFPLTYHPVLKSVAPWTRFPMPADLPAIPTPWTTFEGTANHNSVFSAPWKILSGYQLHLGNSIVEPPTLAGSTLYVGTNSNAVYAVNAVSGAVQWSSLLPNMVMTSPLADRGIVVVGLGNKAFRSYAKTRGWIRGTGVNGLMAFNGATGHELWFYGTTGEDMATPVIQGSTVYEFTGGGRLIAVNLTTGNLRWSQRLGGFDSMSSPIIVGRHLYVAANTYLTNYPATRSTVYAVNLATRHVSWSENLPVASGLSDCSIASDGQRLFVAGVPSISQQGLGTDVSNRVFALNRSNGQVVWKVNAGTGKIARLAEEEEGIPAVYQGTVYIGSPASHELIAIGAKSGRVVWRRHMPTGITANPVVLGSNLLVAGMNGYEYWVSAKTGHLRGQDPAHWGPIGPATPLVVSNALIQTTLNGRLVVQPLGH